MGGADDEVAKDARCLCKARTAIAFAVIAVSKEIEPCAKTAVVQCFRALEQREQCFCAN